MKKPWLAVFGLLIASLVVTARWWPGWYWSWRTDNPVRRGAALAAREGCLSCHAPMGSQETANPGSRWGTVPSFFRGNAMMYVKKPEDVAYFIAEGHAPVATVPPVKPAEGPHPAFVMQTYKKRLSNGQIQDLAAFVLAADGFGVPSEGTVAKGSELAVKFGCESCHGVGGSGGVHNPKSFTGTVPGWIGPDFVELVGSQREFRQWVLIGRSDKMMTNRGASFFLNRASLKMPAFEGTLSDQDVESIWAYVQWLRGNSARDAAQ